MKKIFPVFIFTGLLLFYCTKDKIKIDPKNLMIGTWDYSGYLDNTSIFTRSEEFINNHCYRFNPDGSLTERNYAGFCATPPVSYSDYQGSWTILNDTLISVNVGYWGGTMTYKLDIESVNSNTLKLVNIGND
jgi:hypothetical protein